MHGKPHAPSLLTAIAAVTTLAASTPAEAQDRIAPGLTYEYALEPGPFSIHLLHIDLDSVRLRFVLAMDQILGQETTSSMVARYGALAGVNGGFSVSNDPWTLIHGDPNGFYVRDGIVLSEPVEPRTSFGICTDPDGRQTASIVRPHLEMALSTPAGTLPVLGLNRARDVSDLVMYTAEWGRTTVTSSDGIEIVMRGDRISLIRDGGSTAIPADGYVLSATGAYVDPLRQELQPGMTATLDITVTDADTGRPIPLIGCSYTSAAGHIVRRSFTVNDFSSEGLRPEFTHERHPRTAVGISRDGRRLLIAVVDGRQPELSIGMTLGELADLMLREGMWEAYNLDGGGSSTMVVGPEIVNSPSDERERRRVDAVLVVPPRGGR